MSDSDSVKETKSSPQVLKYVLPHDQAPERLDKVLARLVPEHSRSRLQGWIQAGHVLVNGSAARIRRPVQSGDCIVVHEQPTDESLAFAPEAIELNVIADSPDWIVINKPAGLVTHPGAGNWSGTLLNALLYHYPELAVVPRAGIVHRLDKETSGVLVVARHEKAQTHLVRQLQARSVQREYHGFVHGLLKGSGAIDAPIGRDRRVPVRMATERPVAAKQALTHYQFLQAGELPAGGQVTKVLCRLHTGRTHQIRVHLASIGHPLVGDTLYGGRATPACQRQMLHARTLGFIDYQSGKEVLFEARYPDDFDVLSEELWPD